jgi:hypothetical protein
MEKQRNTRARVVGYDIRPRQKAASKKPLPSSTSHTEIAKKKLSRGFEINFSLPSLKPILAQTIKFKKTAKKVPRKFVITGGVLAIVAGYFVFFNHADIQTQANPTDSPRDVSKAAPSLQQSTPDYDTILPSSKTIAQLGGWTRVSPPDRNPVFAYIDKIGSTQVNVSEQPLPKGFEIESDGQLEQLAAGFKANQKITAGSTQIYIGTSAKGPQSVIFSKSDLLVLIKSVVKISNDQWISYVNSLN